MAFCGPSPVFLFVGAERAFFRGMGILPMRPRSILLLDAVEVAAAEAAEEEEGRAKMALRRMGKMPMPR